MNVTVDKRGNTAILRCDGRLDATTSTQLEASILSVIEKEEKNLLLDFSKVEYLSSAGMRLLLSTTKKMRSVGGKLVIFAMHDDVMEIIRLAGFEQILKICHDEDQAIAQL